MSHICFAQTLRWPPDLGMANGFDLKEHQSMPIKCIKCISSEILSRLFIEMY